MDFKAGPIGVFDSGYGGLTVFKELVKTLPQYDYIYLGDNARAPYGNRPFETVYEYTKECVNYLFSKGCNMVILACNTASAKALRTIQQKDLPKTNSPRRVLGVIRPTAEIIGKLSQTKHVGIFATQGTVNSQSYLLETKKFFPELTLFQEACPGWVMLIENNEQDSEQANQTVQQHVNHLLEQSSKIDTVLLGCTHYPLLINKLKKFFPENILIIPQGEIVANSLVDYLKRHPEMESLCTKNGSRAYYTTGSVEDFNLKAKRFMNDLVHSKHIDLC